MLLRKVLAMSVVAVALIGSSHKVRPRSASASAWLPAARMGTSTMSPMTVLPTATTDPTGLTAVSLLELVPGFTAATASMATLTTATTLITVTPDRCPAQPSR